jgi:hypothetical protein
VTTSIRTATAYNDTPSSVVQSGGFSGTTASSSDVSPFAGTGNNDTPSPSPSSSAPTTFTLTPGNTGTPGDESSPYASKGGGTAGELYDAVDTVVRSMVGGFTGDSAAEETPTKRDDDELNLAISGAPKGDKTQDPLVLAARDLSSIQAGAYAPPAPVTTTATSSATLALLAPDALTAEKSPGAPADAVVKASTKTGARKSDLSRYTNSNPL